MKIAEFPFYPFLILPVAALSLYANNVASFGAYEVMRHIAVLTLCAATAGLALWVVLRSRHAAGLGIAYLAAALLVGPNVAFLAGAAVGLALVCLAVVRLGLVAIATVVANAMILAAVLVVALNIVVAKVNVARSDALPDFGPIAELRASAAEPVVEPPSVAHIVLDGYGNSQALERLFALDNSSFLKALRARGFLVFDNVATPFNQTILSMSTVMNTALPDLDEPPFAGSSREAMKEALTGSISGGAVVRLFERLGHEIVSTSTGFGLLRHPPGARVLAPEPRLELSLFDVYFAVEYLQKWFPEILSPSEIAAPIDRRIRYALSPAVADELREPFFLFAHVLAPHPPFTLRRDGSPTNAFGFSLLGDGDHAMYGDERLQGAYRRGYAEKLRFTNRRTLSLVDRLIAGVEGPVVIIVHGDHGSGTRLVNGSPDETCLAERMFTTAAIYTNSVEIRERFRREGLRNIANLYGVLGSTIFGRPFPEIEAQFFAPADRLRDWIELDGRPLWRNCT